MKTTYLHAFVLVLLHAFTVSICDAQPQSRPAEPGLVAKARELVDTYYGNSRLLGEAAVLLDRAYKADPKNAEIFVEAARITVMGGHIRFDEYQTGTFERYEALLDKAIALDPKNAKAHMLKAQVFDQQGRHDEQLAELEAARALGTTDPWLVIEYASYYESTNKLSAAFRAYTQAEARGPGTTASARKAYVHALRGLRTLPTRGEDVPSRIRKYAALAMEARYPTDAWTPLSYAQDFVEHQLFDEAIHYCREALRTMDFGAARLTLAASLYGRAAQLTLDKAPEGEITALVREASSFGFARSDILDFHAMRSGRGSYAALEPVLRSIVP